MDTCYYALMVVMNARFNYDYLLKLLFLQQIGWTSFAECVSPEDACVHRTRCRS